jgi:hypothetical protein
MRPVKNVHETLVRKIFVFAKPSFNSQVPSEERSKTRSCPQKSRNEKAEIVVKILLYFHYAYFHFLP